ncbi:MAG TPA: site-2 protease family protein [Planctomycetota bacterium]|jgi:Zn-dependent protease
MSDEFTFKLIVVGLVIYATALHEMAHAFVATWCGDPTPGRYGRLTFNPIPHLQPVLTAIVLPLVFFLSGSGLFCLAQTPVDPSRFRHPKRDQALVAFAGPAANFLFMGLMIGILWIPGVWRDDDVTWNMRVLTEGARWCMILGVFNLLPIPPLDGYWIVRGVLPLQLRIQADALARSQMSMVLVLFVGSVIMRSLSLPIHRIFFHLLPLQF